MSRAPKKLYDFKGLAGCVTQRKARQTGTLVGVYQSDQAGMESDPDSPWSTVCEAHSSLVCHSSLRSALASAPDPEMWCEDCRARGNRYLLLGEDPHEVPVDPAIFSLDELREMNKDNWGMDSYDRVRDLDVRETYTIETRDEKEISVRRVS